VRNKAPFSEILVSGHFRSLLEEYSFKRLRDAKSVKHSRPFPFFMHCACE
jgi:hypothetical protein